MVLGDLLGHPGGCLGVSELDHIGDAVDNDGSFAAAGSRQDEDGAVHLINGLFLHGIQRGKTLFQDLVLERQVLFFEFQHSHFLFFMVIGLLYTNSSSISTGRRNPVLDSTRPFSVRIPRNGTASGLQGRAMRARDSCIMLRKPTGRRGRRPLQFIQMITFNFTTTADSVV